jgi:fatty-acyl-CoA synthase
MNKLSLESAWTLDDSANPPSPGVFEFRQESLGAVLLEQALARPNAPAVILPDLLLTYRDLRRRALIVASALKFAGLQPGDYIGLLMESSATYVELIAGASIAGVVFVLFDAAITPVELAQRIDRFKPKFLFASCSARSDLIRVIGQALASPNISPSARWPSEKRSIETVAVISNTGDGAVESYETFAAKGKLADTSVTEVTSKIRLTDLLAVLFTSGVTGSARPCRISHDNVLCNVSTYADCFEIGNDSRIWTEIPMSQMGFLRQFVTAIATGAALITAPHFDPVGAMELMERSRVTHAHAVYATFWLPIIFQPTFRPSRFSALSHVYLTGPMDMLRRAQRTLPQAVVMNAYGTVETGGIFCCTQSDDPPSERLGSVGKPFANHRVRIVNPVDGASCASGEVGEIQVQGPGLPAPHPDDAADLESRYTVDGWLRTEDLGSLGVDGTLYYNGRLSELLRVGGENVSALAIETVLSAHPAVSVAQVIGRKDEKLGEVPAAFVELRPGMHVEPRELVAYCRGHLKARHVPLYVTVVREWPTTASKIRKRALAELPLGPRLAV